MPAIVVLGIRVVDPSGAIFSKLLTIERFRGIKSFTWRPATRTACLVGPGDSTKTTILDAIELALGPRWSVPVNDTDFYGGLSAQGLSVTVTVGQLPAALLDDEAWGLETRGWHEGHGLHDCPQPGDELVLTIKFALDDSLDPTWQVINDRKPDGMRFSSRDRELLGVVRLGGDVDRHLSWARGSALARNTDDFKGVNRVIAAAQREARAAVAGADLKQLKSAALKAQKAASGLGVRVSSDYRPALEPTPVGFGVGQLSLHHGDIPVRASGLGSRRLNALALQNLSVASGAILLIDEVEHGLEPHRLRHLLRVLTPKPGAASGQVLLTTHSPIPVVELRSDNLYAVRCAAGVTDIRHVGQDLQDLARSTPEALLSRRVVVCEGSTEVGLCITMAECWQRLHDDLPVAHTGTSFANGGGANHCGKRAMKLSSLGYATAVLGDSDCEDPPEDELRAVGMGVFLWPGSVSTEQRVALDLPWEALQQMVDLAVENSSEQSVQDAVRERLPKKPTLSSTQIDDWIRNDVTKDEVRVAFGLAAKESDKKKKNKGWFKDVSRGGELGVIVAAALPAVPETPLAQTLAKLAAWIYAD